ncbi:MAG TPA: HAD-IC family P-type ATPase, partial [Candidatus Paceibacterota bacterium]|nr:HAD-IC family P-type ATPase [Candidatus Paceibacterota bacterium]
IRTVILTGDHLQTANFVGRELGILKAANRSIEEAALPANPETIIDDYDVFARITPITKLNLVTAFKNKGHNVAMIGDGVNDAPALIQANLGVAVGSGTDVARETADLILLHDSFSVIVEAIRQGRIILANIKKTVTFLLSGAFTEIILIGGSILLGLPLALLPAQILWVNIIEDGLPAMAFAFESEENNVMKEKPEKRNMVLTRPMKKFIVSFALIADLTLFFLFYVLFKNTGDIDYARTMTFGGLGLTSLFYVFSIKNFSRSFWQAPVLNNRFLNVSVIIGFALYLLAFYAPPLQNIFGTVSIRLLDWLILLGLSFFNVLLIEVSKRFFWGKNSI